MSRKSSSSNSSSGGGGFFGLGLSGIIGSVVAYCNTASFVGWAGVGKSMMVGFGTSVGSTIIGLPAAIGGAVVGGLAGAVARSKKVAIAGALLGGIGGGVAGGVYGGIEGYKVGKGWLTEGQSNVSTMTVEDTFNGAASPDAASGEAPTIDPAVLPAAKPATPENGR